MSIRAIVTTDGSASSHTSGNFALHLNRTIPLEIVLVHALDLRTLEYKMIPDFQVEMIRERAAQAAEKLLEKEKEVFEQAGVPTEARLLTGAPGPAICKLAEQEDVSLVITGRRGQSDVHELLFGSVSNYVVHRCRVPVLVVKRRGPQPFPPEAHRPLRVLVPVDGSQVTRRCIDWLIACDEDCKGMEVTLLHVVHSTPPGLDYLPPGSRPEALSRMHRDGEQVLQKAADRLRDRGFSVTTRVEEGTVGRRICRFYSENHFDLILMGRRGFGELKEMLLGSVSHFVIHHCLGHVLVIP